MRLLHISDIHFREPDCAHPQTDPEQPYRTRLLSDVREQVAEGPPVDLILVGGDVAHHGHADEYTAALHWLGELAVAARCTLKHVLVVPGNHDVDRTVILKNPTTGDAQKAIRDSAPERRERELRTRLGNAESSRTLFAPHAAYNAFAAHFNCQIYGPEKFFWQRDFPLTTEVTLRVNGLTSTLLSGIDGHNDIYGKLYLSPLQTVLDPRPEVVHLVLCHHPPEWFMDGDTVRDAIRNRARIHLFGHKHLQRIVPTGTYVTFSAGAVNPDRYELNWTPGYNIIDLDIVEDGGRILLQVAARLRALQANPERFIAIETDDGDRTFVSRIQLRRNIPKNTPVHAQPNVERPTGPQPGPEPAPSAHPEASMSDSNTRDLIFRFWELPSSRRREICLRLGLITPEDFKTPEPERYGRALLRARELDLLNKLGHEVSKAEIDPR